MSGLSKRTLSTPLPVEEIQKFAEAKLLSGSSCPRCGVQDWEYTDESVSQETLGLNIIDQSHRASGLFATIVFKCRNCGFVAPHAKNVVVEWLNDHE